MAAAPPNPLTSTAQRAKDFATLIPNPSYDPDADPDDVGLDDEEFIETDKLRCISVELTSGAGKLDHATFDYDLAGRNERLVDLQTKSELAQAVEVCLPNDNATSVKDYLSETLFSGDVTIQPIEISPSREGVQIIGRCEKYHFGVPLTGPRVMNNVTDTLDHHADIIFNPEIDGRIEPNRSNAVDPTGEWYLWVDPESVRTPEAQAYLAQSPSLWTLKDAVESLCGLLNADEEFVNNPKSSAISGILTGAPDLKNFTIKRGLYLNEVLDAILEPHGYGWCLDYEPGERTIRLFQRGVGPEKEIFFQRPGATLDLAASNANDVRVEWNVADLANHVIVHGSYVEREITVELKRAWAVADDGMDAEDLRRGAETGDSDSQFEANPNVWRKWVLNEAGDYNGLRPSITEPFELTGILGANNITKRRKFYDPLTYLGDATDSKPERRESPLLEWYDPDDADWKPFKGGFRVLEHECGIWFDETLPPEFLMALDTDARVRITATVRGDTRVTGIAEPRPRNPSGRTITMFIDASDRFHDRKRQTTGTYASTLHTAAGDDRDDTAAIQIYATALRDFEDAARITAQISIPGIHREYKIGDIITRIAGRGISFNRYSINAPQKRYLQIAGMTFNRQPQTTVLHVEEYSDVRANKLRF